MTIREEILFDFSMKMPRLLISGKTGVLDNVKKVVLISESSVVVDHGSRFSALAGRGLSVKSIEEERLIVTGEIEGVEFYRGGAGNFGRDGGKGRDGGDGDGGRKR